MKRKINYLFMLLFLSGCYTAPKGDYNVNSLQDPDCYSRFGGQHGYCDQIKDKDGVLK